MIARADGTPIYHLAVVVDDHDAGITHVVRGADHYSNTPKHMRIYEAMGAEPPVYAHLPLLHGPDGKKLSKRHGAASVQDLRNSGYLREAVINYLALLGWGYDETTTFFTIPELQELFSLERVSQEPGGLRRAEAALDQRPLRARAARVDDLTARLEAFTGRTRPARARSRSRRRRSRRSTSSGRWPARSSTVRWTTRRRARSSSSRASPREALADARAALGGAARAVDRAETVEEALRGVVERTGASRSRSSSRCGSL